MLEDADADALEESRGEGGVTDELIPDETVTYWTCASEVPEEQIETTIERLQELSQSKLGEVNDVERIDELDSEISDLRNQQRRREELERGIEDADRDIEGATSRINVVSMSIAAYTQDHSPLSLTAVSSTATRDGCAEGGSEMI